MRWIEDEGYDQELLQDGHGNRMSQWPDLKDHERVLVWIDGRFSHILPSGLHAYWTGQKEVRVEIVDARQPV